MEWHSQHCNHNTWCLCWLEEGLEKESFHGPSLQARDLVQAHCHHTTAAYSTQNSADPMLAQSHGQMATSTEDQGVESFCLPVVITTSCNAWISTFPFLLWINCLQLHQESSSVMKRRLKMVSAHFAARSPTSKLLKHKCLACPHRKGSSTPGLFWLKLKMQVPERVSAVHEKPAQSSLKRRNMQLLQPSQQKTAEGNNPGRSEPDIQDVIPFLCLQNTDLSYWEYRL